jgi:hypothetical protein
VPRYAQERLPAEVRRKKRKQNEKAPAEEQRGHHALGAAALDPRDRRDALARTDTMTRARILETAQQGGGNAAVARTLARQPTVADKDAPGAIGGAEKDKKADELFIRLPPGSGWLSGYGPNRAAEGVEQQVADLSEQKHGLLGSLQYLKYGEDKLGPEALHQVEGMQKVLEKKTAGKAGEEFNKIVLTYSNASTKVASKLYDVTAAERNVVKTTDDLEKVTTDKAILEGKREEAKAGEDVKKVEAEIETAKKWAGAIFDAAFDVLKGDWKDALSDLGKFAGKELLVNWMMDDVYSSKLAEAQKKLEAIKAKVTGLEDKSALLNIKARVEELEANKNTLKARQKELLMAAREARAAWKIFEGRLRALGKAGNAAADALDAREDIANVAKLAIQEVTDFDEAVQKFKVPLDKAYYAYHNYFDFLTSPGGKNMVASDEDMMLLIGAVQNNQRTISQLKEWREKELPDIAAAKSWVAGGEYMADFDLIDGVLADVAGGG